MTMRTQFPYRHRVSRRHGSMLVMFAVCLPVLMVMIVFAVDIAFMQLTRTELRTAADASARAASRTLSLEQDADAAIAAGKFAATQNVVANKAFELADEDIVLGIANRPGNTGRFIFSPGGTRMNSAQVRARRTADSPAGKVNLFFGRWLGTDSFEPVITSVSTQIDRDIVLVIDRSGSMSFLDTENDFQDGWVACDPAPTECRWRGLLAATVAFLDELDKTPQLEQVGLATYSNFGTSDVQLTDDYSSILSRLNDITNNFCGGSTAIGRGMIEGIDIVANQGNDRPFAARVMVVLTDGIHNTPTPTTITPEEIAVDAAAEDITIFSVTFSDFAEQARMQTVAETGNGQHFHAPTSEELVDVFRTIAQTAANLITE